MISIVDDDEAVRESTKALVRSLGYNARAFGSAEEFLDSNPDDTSVACGPNVYRAFKPSSFPPGRVISREV